MFTGSNLAWATATSLVLMGASFPSIADVSLSYSGAGNNSVFHIGGNKLAIDMGDAQGDGGLLYDLDSDTIYAIQHSEKQYIAMDEMMQQAMGMKSQMKQMLDAQMAGMSDAEKAQMESMMSGMLGGLMGNKEEPETAPKTTFNFTGEKDTVGEYTCEKVDMTLGNGDQQQVCVAAAESLGIGSADEAVLHGMMKKLTGLSDQISQFSGEYSFGFVGDFKEVLVKSYTDDQMQLTGVSELLVPVESLVIPEGYSKADMNP
ncbi:MAG: hypothetical protein ACI9J2_002250 [Saprospiraceae bacterium]|jgi:hypothetical protein